MAMRADSLDMTEPDLSFQHYKVLRQADGCPWELGRGSMGITYKAFDVNLCCEVALKVINAATLEHPHARDRFVSEARAAAKLRHRNIASVYHLGNDGEHYFYAMEFVDGKTLDTLVRESGPLPVAAALRILLQAARALAAASRQGLVHRDLKPANIMVTHEDDDDEMLVKIIDFGLAKPIASADGSRPLTFGGFVGTPQFASPEQLEERPVDARSDIYSLGATTWFLLTGRAPFVGPLATICHQHLTQSPPWSQLPKPFPETVRTLLALMLEKNPVHRPADAVDLRRQIEASLEVIREPASSVVPVQRKYVAKPVNWSRARLARPAVVSPPSENEPPRTGIILKGRYELLRLVGEGKSGRVFLARDRAANEALIAIKVLHPELVGSAAELERLGEEVSLIQAAAHVQLIAILSLESLPTQETAFLVEEWLHGFTLLDFLAVRGGALPLVEGLRLVEQAAAVADHAESRRLEKLDFALHQFHLHFPAARGPLDDLDGAREPMRTAMSHWPAWCLKLNPLGALRNGLESSTWAGDVTLIPSGDASGKHEALAKASPSLRETYTRGTAQLTYELLGGAPVSPTYARDRRTQCASLPALNEEANAVLQRALLDGSSFANGREFYEAVARAAGLDPFNLPLTGMPGSGARQTAGFPTLRKSLPVVPMLAAGDIPKFGVADTDDGSGASTVVGRTVTTSAAVAPTATFDDRGEPVRDDLDPWNSGAEGEPSNVWDRLALVSGEGTSTRWWIGGITLAFVVLCSASMALLETGGHRPSRKALPPTVASDHARKGSAPSVRRDATRPLPTNPVLAVDAANATDLSLPVRVVHSTPGAVPTEKVPEVSSTPPPLSADASGTSVRVHVDSQPQGARVFVKGKVLGVTPFDTSIAAGDYQLTARYKSWPEVHQSLHLEAGQTDTSVVTHFLPPESPTPANPGAVPFARTRHAPDDASIKRNFVHSTRGVHPAPTGGTPPTPSPEGSPSPAGEVRRALPTLHPFDPDGVFRQNGRSRDDGD